MILDTRFRLALLLIAALLTTSSAPAQEEPTDQPETAPEMEAEPITLGIQLTPQLLDSLLDKAARRLAKDYGFDDYQEEQMRQVLHERVPKFVRQHQAELQGLLNEHLEAMASEEPPTPEYAADWSARLLPMVEEFRGMVGGVSEGMREFMTDDQEVLLDGYLAVFETATQFADNRLHEFKDGGFDPETHWPRSKHFQQLEREDMIQVREEMEYARATAMSGSPPAPRQRTGQAPAHTTGKAPEYTTGQAPAHTEEAKLAADAKPVPRRPTKTAEQAKDEWTRYVEAFIQRYQLNEEQQQKAHSFLRQQSEHRERYLLGKGRKMLEIENMFKNAKTDEQIELAESVYQRLHTPVGRMFEQLKEKLDTLPTRRQRRAAALAEKQKPAQHERSSKETAGKPGP